MPAFRPAKEGNRANSAGGQGFCPGKLKKDTGRARVRTDQRFLIAMDRINQRFPSSIEVLFGGIRQTAGKAPSASPPQLHGAALLHCNMLLSRLIQ